MAPNHSVEVASMIIACVIVLGGMLIGLLLGLRATNRKVAHMEAQPEPPQAYADPYRGSPGAPVPNPTANAPLYYVLSVFFWPAAFGLGIHFLRDRKTARMGATCVKIGMGVIGTVGLLTCISMSAITVLVKRAHTYPSTPYVAPYSGTQDSPSSLKGNLHEPTVVGNEVVTVHAVDLQVMPKNGEPSSKYVAMDVSIRNDSKKTFYAGSSLRLFDTDGHTFMSVYSDAKEPKLNSVSLTPGSSLRGWVTFKMPKESSVDRLQYTANGSTFDGQPRLVEFSLVP